MHLRITAFEANAASRLGFYLEVVVKLALVRAACDGSHSCAHGNCLLLLMTAYWPNSLATNSCLHLDRRDMLFDTYCLLNGLNSFSQIETPITCD
jgi:hypothetical protein